MGDLIPQLTRIIQNPTSNLTAAVLLLAALTLLVLIIIIALLLVVTRPPASRGRKILAVKGRPEDEYEYPELSAELAPRLPGEPAPRPQRVGRFLAGRSGAWLVAILAILAVAVGYAASSTQGYCRDACHIGDPGMSDKARAEHKTAACVACHEDPRPRSAPGALALRTAHLVGQVVPNVHVYAAPVPSRRCLACHGNIRRGVIETTGGSRMSHREPLEAGMACRDCHGDVGHEPVARVPGMAKCVRCHDSKTASAQCRSCHLEDTGHASAAAGASRGFPRVQLGPVTDCGGCHDQKSCDECHGIRMPHTVEFMRYKHARSGAFEGKQVCWRCHPKTDCSACHLDFPGHTGDWKAQHKTVERRAWCECHWARMPEDAKTPERFCGLCH